jgi:hypothetical protein
MQRPCHPVMSSGPRPGARPVAIVAPPPPPPSSPPLPVPPTFTTGNSVGSAGVPPAVWGILPHTLQPVRSQCLPLRLGHSPPATSHCLRRSFATHCYQPAPTSAPSRISWATPASNRAQRQPAGWERRRPSNDHDSPPRHQATGGRRPEPTRFGLKSNNSPQPGIFPHIPHYLLGWLTMEG